MYGNIATHTAIPATFSYSYRLTASNMSKTVSLEFLTKKEKEWIVSVMEKDLKLQKEEETRIQYVASYVRLLQI